jgi:PmbA protein
MNEWELAEHVLAHCRQQKAEAEVFIQRSRSTCIEVKDQKLQTFKLADDEGIGLRVITNRQQGFAFRTDCSKKNIDSLILSAVAVAQYTQADEHFVLPAPPAAYPEVDCFDPQLDNVSVRDKIGRTMAVEQAAYNYDPRIKRIRQVLYKDIQYQAWVANTSGIRVDNHGSQCAVSTLVIAEDNGEAQVGWEMDNSHTYAGLKSADYIGQEAARRAVEMLGARQIPTRRSWVVMDPNVFTDFLGMIAAAFSAYEVQKGKSLLAGKLGSQVASPHLTLVDDGLCMQGMSTALADGEGVPTSRTVLIEQGRLTNYLHNTYTAHKEGIASTGNGMRDDFKQPPGVGITNLYIEPGSTSRQELLAQTQAGLYISNAMGTHTIDAVSGDYSVGASGYWVEQGEFTHPVRGVVISGNILDLFQNIDLIADDLRFVGAIGAPTVRFCDIMISGTSHGLA